MKAKIKHILLQLFATNIGRILVGVVLSLIGGIMSPNGTIGEMIYDYNEGMLWLVIFYIGTTLWVGHVIVFILSGLIINPIKSFIGKIKNK
jgi:hypothetical protein